MTTVLVVSPHPDDEAIGCGGVLRKHVLDGHDTHVAFLTSGEAGGHGREEAGTVREREAETAAAILGLASIEFWRHGDGRLGIDDEPIDRLTTKLVHTDPDYIYVPHEGEMHPDHQASTGILRQALQRNGMSSAIVRTYEVWTPMQVMEHIEDISDVIDTKLEAVRAYRSQCDVMRFDEAIGGLNRYRGEMHSWPGGDYAEVFGALSR